MSLSRSTAKLALLISSTFYAQYLLSAELACNRTDFSRQSALNSNKHDQDNRLHIYAEDVSGNSSLFTLKNRVEIRYLGQTIKTDVAEYNDITGEVTTPEKVELSSNFGQVQGVEASFDLTNQTANFSNAEFLLPDGSRGSAKNMQFKESGTHTLSEVIYSGCPKNSTGWELIAPEIILDNQQQRGSARNVRLEFADIPILYIPYFSFPLNNQRKSGFLFPSLDSSEKNGIEIGIPYYWNLAENYDLTFTPTLLTDRGFQIQNEFRHLHPYSKGRLNFDFLVNDKKRGGSRSYFNLGNQFTYGPNWDIDVDIANVSDNNYFIDFGGSLVSSAISNLNRSITAKYYGNNWQFSGMIQDYQIIDPRISANEEPYQILPQLAFLTNHPLVSFSHLDKNNRKISKHELAFITESELINFNRNVGVDGLRLNVFPKLNHTYQSQAFEIDTTLGIQHTQYELNNTQPLLDTRPSRTLPIFNIDTRINLERNTQHSFLPDVIQPRVQYTYIPYRDQTNIPLFDTGLPDITQNQLFNPSRFTGIDRIGDTNQLTLGLSSWLIGDQQSEQKLNLNIGQIYYFDDRRIGLTQDNIQDSNTSEIIAEGFWQPNNKLGIRSGLSWDPDLNAAVRRELGVSYRPSDRKLFNLGYRFVSRRVDQLDLAFRYPVNTRMNLVGRWNYDRINRTTLDRYWGLEYDTCCWSIRAISRRYLTDRSGNSDNAFLLQLELKGLSSVGARADRLLEDNIFIEQP